MRPVFREVRSFTSPSFGVLIIRGDLDRNRTVGFDDLTLAQRYGTSLLSQSPARASVRRSRSGFDLLD